MTKSETQKFAWLRIVFGVVWAIDAFFKWQPDFLNNFVSYFPNTFNGQPALINDWITLWLHIVNSNPQLFAITVAILETAIALTLLFGILKKSTTYVGIILSLIIWSTAEGFGGPYGAGSTDIGAAIIYVLVFLALYYGHAWDELSLKRGR
jgi:uncharacterized membrane protein YphA (DoxX/SURF4 family)